MITSSINHWVLILYSLATALIVLHQYVQYGKLPEYLMNATPRPHLLNFRGHLNRIRVNSTWKLFQRVFFADKFDQKVAAMANFLYPLIMDSSKVHTSVVFIVAPGQVMRSVKKLYNLIEELYRDNHQDPTGELIRVFQDMSRAKKVNVFALFTLCVVCLSMNALLSIVTFIDRVDTRGVQVNGFSVIQGRNKTGTPYLRTMMNAYVAIFVFKAFYLVCYSFLQSSLKKNSAQLIMAINQQEQQEQLINAISQSNEVKRSIQEYLTNNPLYNQPNLHPPLLQNFSQN